MEIRRIRREEFNQLVSFASELTPFIGEGAEWFTDDACTAVGVVTRGLSRLVWSYAVLKRGRVGDFKVVSLGEDYSDLRLAGDACLGAMTAARQSKRIDSPEEIWRSAA